MGDNLKPCPFCGSTELRTERNPTRPLWQVECYACWGVMASTVSQSKAEHDWNRRWPEDALRARAEAAEARAAQAEAAGYRRAIDDACAAVRAEHKQALEEHRKQSDHEWRSANYGRLSALREVESVVRALAPIEPVSKADELPGGAA